MEHKNNYAEATPLYVSAAKVHEIIVGVSRKTFANWRCQKTGPKYFLIGSKPYYRIQDLEDFFSQRPMLTNYGNEI